MSHRPDCVHLKDNSYKITIPFILPSLNTYIAQCYQGSSTAQSFKQSWENKIKRYFKPLDSLEHLSIYIIYHWYEPNQVRDKSNICSFGMKVIEDTLVRLHIIDNDGWKNVVGFEHEFQVDPKRPRVEVEIMVID